MLYSIKFGVGAIFLFLSMPSIALAQVNLPNAASPSETTLPLNRSLVPSSPGVESTPDPVSQDPVLQETPEFTPLSCPAGQFASKFSDVMPDDWAYEAVNRLASGQFRCFPLLSHS